MKSYDFNACAYDGDVYCIDCLPEGLDPDSEEVAPVFAGGEWDYYPCCCHCGELHDYVTLTPAGREFEEQAAADEDIRMTFRFGDTIIHRE